MFDTEKKRQADCGRKLASYLPLSQKFLYGYPLPNDLDNALSDSSTFTHRDPGSTGIPLDS